MNDKQFQQSFRAVKAFLEFETPRCLYCDAFIQTELSWVSFFTPERPKYLCTNCEEQLQAIQGDCCERCHRPFAQMDPKFRQENLCYDCVRWEKDPSWRDLLSYNRSLYVYNDFLKELIAKFKFRGDYVLANVFTQGLQKLLTSLAYDELVPIPLSKERLYERGFNQAEACIVTAGLKPSYCLSRIHSEKQSKKSREERIHLAQVFQLEEDVRSKRIVLIDDVYTTGSTLMHAAKTLKEGGASSVMAITIARG